MKFKVLFLALLVAVFAAFSGVASAQKATDPVPQDEVVAGDIDGDGKVNLIDLSILLSKWESTTKDEPADLNNDGAVDILDLSIVLSNYNDQDFPD